MERYEEALTDFNRAIDLDPDDAWVIISRGEHTGYGRYEEALTDFNRAIDLDPDGVGHRQPGPDLPAYGPVRGGAGRPQPRHRIRPRAWAIAGRVRPTG